MKHDYLKSTCIDNVIFIIDARIDKKNHKIFCGFLDIESLSEEKKTTVVISETGIYYTLDTDFSEGEIIYPCNQFNVTLTYFPSTS